MAMNPQLLPRVLRAFLLLSVCAACLHASAQNRPLTVAYQLTHSVNEDITLAPDGKSMVIVSVIAGREQLVRMGIDGSDPRQLTHDDADHEDPAWSPDGRQIAYVLVKGDVEQIQLMNADGSVNADSSQTVPLTPAGVKTIHPNWAPDGRSIAYCTDDDLKPPKKNDSQIYSIDIATRKVRTLISGGVNTYPVWSPDGKRLAFRRMLGESNSEVFIANSDGTGAQNLTNDPAFDGWPAWSPDGTRIAFASNRARSYEIYIMNPDGSAVQKVAATEGRATAPKWSADGKTIYFPNCWKNDFAYDCQVYAARLDAFPK